MRKVLAYIGIVVVVLVVGLAGFVWWSLQPRPDPQPLPETLVDATGPEGEALLESANASADYDPLAEHFVHQNLKSYCGVASSVIVLNALGKNVSQESFFDGQAGTVRSRLSVALGGMSLPELAALLEAHGVVTNLRHASDSTVQEFRSLVQNDLSTESGFVIVNYQREVLGQGRVGHISPLAAYDAASDRVLILDTADYKYPPTWVPLADLFAAMDTIDPASGKTRGYVEVSAAFP